MAEAALTDIVRFADRAGVEYPPTPTPTPPGHVSDFSASEDELPPMISHVVTMSGKIALILQTDSMTSIGWIRNQCATHFSVPAIRCKLLRGTLILITRREKFVGHSGVGTWRRQRNHTRD